MERIIDRVRRREREAEHRRLLERIAADRPLPGGITYVLRHTEPKPGPIERVIRYCMGMS